MGKAKLQNAIMKGPLLFIILALVGTVFMVLLGFTFWRGGGISGRVVTPPKVEKPLTAEEKAEVLAETLNTSGSTESLNEKEEQELYDALDNPQTRRKTMTETERRTLFDSLNGI